MMYKILETLRAKIEKKNGKIKIDTVKNRKIRNTTRTNAQDAFISNTSRTLIGRYQKAHSHIQGLR